MRRSFATRLPCGLREAHEALKEVACSNNPEFSCIADQLLMMLLEPNDGRTIGGGGTFLRPLPLADEKPGAFVAVRKTESGSART